MKDWRRGRRMPRPRVEPAIADELRPMDIQFDQCEKPRRTLTCACRAVIDENAGNVLVAMPGPEAD